MVEFVLQRRYEQDPVRIGIAEQWTRFRIGSQPESGLDTATTAPTGALAEFESLYDEDARFFP